MTVDELMEFIDHLKPGSSYLFEHIRKGPFVAEYVGIRPTKEGDPQDAFFLDVNIVTEDGSGQERLANTFIRDEFGRKMRPAFEGRLIRPSLLRSIASPSSKEQEALMDKFRKAREKANRGDDGEPIFATPSMPTDKALAKLEPEKKPGLFNRMFGRRNH